MGKTFGEFAVGQRFETPGRTVTESDVMIFAGLTGDYNPVHTDEGFAASTPFGTRIAHGPMGIGMAFGLASRLDLIDGTVVALLGVTWKFTAPVKPGDTIKAGIEVLQTRDVKNPEHGFVEWSIEIVNQTGAVTSSGTAQLLMRRQRPASANWGETKAL
ncbi:MAG: MaoC/PaaZ C-terminal domain-containing protein [Rhodospirillales bacterium]